jgi:hypothetical protein
MAADGSIGVGLILSIAFWVAVIGGIAAFAVWLLVMYMAKSEKFNMAQESAMREKLAAGTMMTEPAEEGGRLDEWDLERLDRAA